jgi:hypothetical protein
MGRQSAIMVENVIASAGVRRRCSSIKEIDLVADDPAHAPHVLCCLLHLSHERLEIHLVLSIQERIDVPKGRVTQVHFALAFGQHALDRLLIYMAIHASLGPAGSP